jgi:hypothetical protein
MLALLLLSAGQWAVCCPLLMMVLLTLMSSPYNLVGITVVRYMSVRWPLHHTSMLTRKRTLVAIFFTWLPAVSFALGFYVRLKPGEYKACSEPVLFGTAKEITSKKDTA